MATPVPVVSMMYFLVFTPPKTTGAVRPAFLATSEKWASGLGLFFGSWLAPKRMEKGRSRINEIQGALKRKSERGVRPEIMNSWHTKVQVRQGQDGASKEELAGRSPAKGNRVFVRVISLELSTRIELHSLGLSRRLKAGSRLGSLAL